ncbi:MAG: hemolysin family protein [Eubacteriales bacterium]
MSDTAGLWTIVLCVLLSAYFSAAETAFNSVNKVRMKNLDETGDISARRVLKLLDRYEKLLSTILVGNNMVNVAATSVATVLCVRMWGSDQGSALATLISTLVLLFFGEITPKTLAIGSADSYAMHVAGSLEFFITILTPLTALFGLWQKLLLKIFKPKDDSSVTDEEILTIVKTAEEEGEIDKQESALITNSIDFNETLTEDILTPRVDIEAVELGCTKEEVMEIFARTGLSRIPVYEKDIDHIIGVLYVKDFYNKIYGNNGTVRSIIRPVVFTTEHRPIGDLFRELQSKKIHMAIVLDEYGGTLGIVTMEDILEELVGEIWDEHEQAEPEIRKASDGVYIVSGSMNLEKFFEKIGEEYSDDEESLTVSGWLVDQAGHLPRSGEKIEVPDHHLIVEVMEVNEHRIEQVRVEVVKPEPEEENTSDEAEPEKENDKEKDKKEEK